MTPDQKAKLLLTDMGCHTCINSIELDGELQCDVGNMNGNDWVAPIPLPEEGICDGWERGWNNEFLELMEESTANGSTSGMVLFDGKDGKPRYVDATGVEVISIQSHGLYIDGKKIK